MANAARRFPLAVLLSASLTAFHVFDIGDILDLSGDATLRITLGHVSAFFWALAIALRAEAADWGVTRRFGLALAGIGVIAALHAFPRTAGLQPFQLCAALAILPGLASYLARRRGDIGPAFWQSAIRSSSRTGSVAYAPDRPAHLDVEGFTSFSGPYQFMLSQKQDTREFTVEARPDRRIKLTVSRTAITLEDPASGASDRLPFTKLVETVQRPNGLGALADGAEATRPGRPPHLFVHKLGDMRIGLFFQHFTGNRDESGFRYLTGRLWVLIGAAP